MQFSPYTILLSDMDYKFDNSTFNFDGCDSRSCVNVTIVDDMRAEPLTKISRDKFHVALLGHGLDNSIILNPDTSVVYIRDNDCLSL